MFVCVLQSVQSSSSSCTSTHLQTKKQTKQHTNMTFPAIDLVPKKETRVLDFWQEHPAHDGSQVVVGIFDTGLDPGAHGVQCLPDGLTPKLLDVIDCTGSGDVDVSTAAQAEWKQADDNIKNEDDGDNGYWQVQGLTGRTLRLNAAWKFCPFPESQKEETAKDDAPSDDTKESKNHEDSDKSKKKKTVPVRLGVKAAYELYPAKLTTRVKAERAKTLDEHVRQYVAKVRGDLAALEQNSNSNNHNNDDKDNKSQQQQQKQKRVRDDLKARLAVLGEEWPDPGPIHDCVVFYDGQHYRAVVDVHETGRLDLRQPLTSYGLERQYDTFGSTSALNFAVQFYNAGTILSLVSDASPHGTHVAGITAGAETGDCNDRSGVAPGAALVSFKIGDSRLGGMETGTSLTRALIQAVQHKCDVINMSYGEGCVLPNTGRFMELLEDVVWKHNIIFVSSAGNNGPALSTVGAPGGSCSAAIGVAAYVSPDMMKANYSMSVNNNNNNNSDTATDEDLPMEKHEGTTYTWSSVGPTADGDNGVLITAPGGAITSVSNWCLQKSML